MKIFQLGERSFSFLDPYIISEIGVNHEGSIDRAKRMIQSAAEAGAHAVKFQTYKADLLATRESSPSYWDRQQEPATSQHALFKRWDSFGEEEYRELAAYCNECGVDFMSTPFDMDAVELVAALAPAIKVASADVTNVPLLRRIGASGLPVVMSTGGSRFDEAAVAIHELRESGALSVSLLHCVLNYPTPPENAELAQIVEIQRLFGDDCAVGYSDHVQPDRDCSMPALEIAALLGATVIEKHFTDDKSAPGNDHYHAMDADNLGAFTAKLAAMRRLYGSPTRNLSKEASAIKNARRRVVANVNLIEGQVIRKDDLIALRADHGIEIAHWDRVVGQTAARTVAGGKPLGWADLK